MQQLAHTTQDQSSFLNQSKQQEERKKRSFSFVAFIITQRNDLICIIIVLFTRFISTTKQVMRVRYLLSSFLPVVVLFDLYSYYLFSESF